MATFQAEFFSTSLKRLVPVSVVIPVEQSAAPGSGDDRPYKTIYLLHGYSGSNTDWLRESRISLLSQIYRVAVVMPSCNNSFYLDDEAMGEYYGKYVAEELVELTRKVFPLSNRREDTTIAGLSMGGYGAMRNGLKHNDVFGSIVALSSAFITDQVSQLKEGEGTHVAPYSYYAHVFGDLKQVSGSDKDPKALASGLLERGEALPRIYMACGTEDFLLEPNRSLHRHLTEIGYAHEYRENAGVHNWAFWDDHIEKAMEWLYGKPQAGQ